MSAGFSKQIRFYALQQLLKGRTSADVSAETGVAERTLQTWIKEAKAEGRYASKPSGRPRRSKLDGHLDFIREAHLAAPHISIRDLVEKLRTERGVSISVGALWDFLDRVGITIDRRRSRLD